MWVCVCNDLPVIYTPFSQETMDGVIKVGSREDGDEVGGVDESEGKSVGKRKLEILEDEWEEEREEEDSEGSNDEEGEVEELRIDEGKEVVDRKDEVEGKGEEKEMVGEGSEDEGVSKAERRVVDSSEGWIVDWGGEDEGERVWGRDDQKYLEGKVVEMKAGNLSLESTRS